MEAAKLLMGSHRSHMGTGTVGGETEPGSRT